MGSGKSLIGSSLAKKLGIPFIDLDMEFENRSNFTISEFFSKYGEMEFRMEETRLLKEITIMYDSFVIATGGGTPCFHDNIKWMNDNGITVYINLAIQTLISRLNADKQKRPLICTLESEELRVFIENLFVAREGFYQQSKIKILAENISPENLIQQIYLSL